MSAELKTAALKCEGCGLVHGLSGFALGRACLDALKARVAELEGHHERQVNWLRAWAEYFSKAWLPDLRIGPDSNPYLWRWNVAKAPDGGHVYLHRFFRSDDDRALHDHPWSYRSLVLAGGYWEVTPAGRFWRNAGEQLGPYPPEHRHMVVLPEGQEALTLVVTGPHVRNWGFWCGERFVPWRDFTQEGPGGTSQHIGKGCG